MVLISLLVFLYCFFRLAVGVNVHLGEERFSLLLFGPESPRP